MNFRPAHFLCALTLGCSPVSAATAIATGQSADIVLGQTDFISQLVPATPTAASLDKPSGVAVDPVSGKVYFADNGNHRVLRYDSVAAMTTGGSAEAFFGQTSASSNGSATTAKEMNAPFGVALDGNGTLWVADTANNRVLRFDNAATKGPFAITADGVLGQPDFSTKTILTPPTQASMSAPRAVTVDAKGTLWVADFGNNRVLRFDEAASVINGANADGVLGAPNFAVNFGGVATQYAMHGPIGLITNSAGHLWVADYSNNRVLRFDDAANLGNGALASHVLGQPDFVTHAAPASPTAASLNHPAGLALDAAGNLWVSDALNSRILRFDAASNRADNASANGVLGQSDLTTNGSAVTATGLSAPFGLFVDPAGALWAADTLNNRMLHYTPQLVPSTKPIPAAAITIALTGKKKLFSKTAKITVRGTASCADGIARVEYRLGTKGAFKAAVGSTAWTLQTKVPRGRVTLTIRAVSAKGFVSLPVTVRIKRR